MKKDMAEIMVSLDRLPGTNRFESAIRYGEIRQLLQRHYRGLRFRHGSYLPPPKGQAMTRFGLISNLILIVVLAAVVFLFVLSVRPAPAQEVTDAEKFIPLPQPRPGTAPILPDAPLIYHKPGYFPQLDVTDRITLSLLPNLPPAEYDHPYQGRLRIIYLDTPQSVDRMCRLVALRGFITPPGHKTYLGCAIRSDLVKLDPNADCVIFIMENISHLRDNQTLNGLMRHEIGHCNGWNNHNGMRDASAEPSLVPTGSKKPWVPVQ